MRAAALSAVPVRVLVLAACAASASGSAACRSSRTAPPPAGPDAPPVTPTAALPTNEPGVYQDPEGLFTMRFGARPDVDVKREPLGAGEIVTTTLSVASDTRLAMTMKLEMSEVAAYDCQKGLDGMRDRTLGNMGCEPTQEKPLELRGHPGREVLFSCTKRPMRGAMAVYCDDTAVAAAHRVIAYEVIAAYADQAWDEADARIFLAGFSLR
jgi:hypothetical protein